MKGGGRRGVGRPQAAEPTRPVSVRMTARQHAKYMELGGARWIKRLLNEANGKA